MSPGRLPILPKLPENMRLSPFLRLLLECLVDTFQIGVVRLLDERLGEGGQGAGPVLIGFTRFGQQHVRGDRGFAYRFAGP